MRKFLEGKKTYITSSLGVAVVVAWALSYISSEVAIQLLALLGFSNTAALKAAISRGPQS